MHHRFIILVTGLEDLVPLPRTTLALLIHVHYSRASALRLSRLLSYSTPPDLATYFVDSYHQLCRFRTSLRSLRSTVPMTTPLSTFMQLCHIRLCKPHHQLAV